MIGRANRKREQSHMFDYMLRGRSIAFGHISESYWWVSACGRRFETEEPIECEELTCKYCLEKEDVHRTS